MHALSCLACAAKQPKPRAMVIFPATVHICMPHQLGSCTTRLGSHSRCLSGHLHVSEQERARSCALHLSANAAVILNNPASAAEAAMSVAAVACTIACGFACASRHCWRVHLIHGNIADIACAWFARCQALCRAARRACACCRCAPNQSAGQGASEAVCEP